MNRGSFNPIVPGLGLADENARLKQQLAVTERETARVSHNYTLLLTELAERNAALGVVTKALEDAAIICEMCDAEEPLKVGMCLTCWDNLVEQYQTAKAKLAMATGLLESVNISMPATEGSVPRVVGPELARRIASFLADPSQVATQYCEALAVVERVRTKLEILTAEQASDPFGKLSLRTAFIGLLKEILGEEKP